jgi:site-specific DNA recombinase
MNAAIYARKSTDEPGRATEQKSVVRQEELARAFALRQGWTVTHVFVDDGISGAEFEKRPGLQRLLGSLKPKPPFQVLIVSEQKSIGREMTETGMTVKTLALAGVEIFEYMDGKSLTPKNAMDKVVGALQGFGDDTHREQTSRRVHEAFTRLHSAGHVVGGRCFGYRNQDVFNGVDVHGRPLKSHVERVIDPTEAAVVLRIFEMYDSGLGLKRIAKQLTSEHAVAPKPFVRKDPTKVLPIIGWAPSTVRAVLTRETYHGVIVWNKTKKKDSWGHWAPSDRPEREWQHTEAPELRIVPEDLWKRVESRRKDTEGRTVRFLGEKGRINGRPPKSATQNLLAGLATCALCGGGLIVETSARKRGRVPEYVCARRRLNGTCPNALRMAAREVNEAVLQAIEEHALTPEAIEAVIQLSERDDVADLQAKLDSERKDIEKKITRLVGLVETGSAPAALIERLHELEARLHALAVEAVALRPVPRLAPAVIENRLAEWRRLLRQSTTQSRTVLQRIIRGRITFTPRVNEVSGEVDGYDFTAPTRFDKLFTGIAVERPKNLDPNGRAGLEGIGPEDTGDAEYGLLLDNHALRVASPTGFEPVFWP